MIGVILRTLLFLAVFAVLLAYIGGIIWLGSTILQPMWGMIPAMLVALGGGIVLPIAIFFGVITRD